eukprot:3858156-Amphidinium_carterae.2
MSLWWLPKGEIKKGTRPKVSVADVTYLVLDEASPMFKLWGVVVDKLDVMLAFLRRQTGCLTWALSPTSER